MNYTALYSTPYHVYRLTHTAAEAFTQLFGVQLLVLYGLAIVADVPLASFADSGLCFAAVLTAFIFVSHVFNTVLARTNTRYRRV